jgi:hypothetical protein
MAENPVVTAEERELLRKLRNGEVTYSPENHVPPNVIRRPLPTVVPKAPPAPPEKPKSS